MSVDSPTPDDEEWTLLKKARKRAQELAARHDEHALRRQGPDERPPGLSSLTISEHVRVFGPPEADLELVERDDGTRRVAGVPDDAWIDAHVDALADCWRWR